MSSKTAETLVIYTVSILWTAFILWLLGTTALLFVVAVLTFDRHFRSYLEIAKKEATEKSDG